MSKDLLFSRQRHWTKKGILVLWTAYYDARYSWQNSGKGSYLGNLFAIKLERCNRITCILCLNTEDNTGRNGGEEMVVMTRRFEEYCISGKSNSLEKLSFSEKKYWPMMNIFCFAADFMTKATRRERWMKKQWQHERQPTPTTTTT